MVGKTYFPLGQKTLNDPLRALIVIFDDMLKYKVDLVHTKYSVSEIKLLSCALAGCTSPKTVHPEIAPCTLPI